MQKLLFTVALTCLSLATVAQSAFGEPVTLKLEAEGSHVKAAWANETHEFGEIPQGVPVTHVFKVVNEGNKPLEISRVKPTCGCTATNYSKDPIAPGEEGYVEATYEAKNIGFFSKTVAVTTNDDETANFTLRLVGTVVEQPK